MSNVGDVRQPDIQTTTKILPLSTDTIANKFHGRPASV
jgi:hypothetical protein